MTLKLRQIEAFRAVMREGSMVRASNAMAITQPAVSYLIGSLESSVGFVLFSRQGGKLTPTPEAVQLMTEVDHLYHGLEGIESAAKRIANYDKAVIRILMSQALAASRLLSSVGQFAAAHPGIKLDLDVGHRTTILHRINSAQIDLGILSLTPEVIPRSTKLLGSELLCVSACSKFLNSHFSATPKCLAEIPIITLRTSGLVRRIVDAWFSDAGITPNYVIEAADPAMAIELVRGGLGVTIVSSISVPQHDASLMAVPLAPEQKIEIGTVTPSLQHPNRAVIALIEFLKTSLAE